MSTSAPLHTNLQRNAVKRWYHHWVLWAVLVLGTTMFFGWPTAKRRYQRWNADRQVRLAANFLAQGDIEHAILSVRGVLRANPANIEATRIVAVALEKAGSAQAAAGWRSVLDSLQPGDVENMLAWADDSLKAGDNAAAERILALIKGEARNLPSYHATAAGLAMAKGDAAGAELHWTEASRLSPDEDGYRFPIAAGHLKSAKPEIRASAISELTKLSQKPTQRLKALRVLLQDAIECKTWFRASELADALVAESGATFGDKLTKLAVLRAMVDRESVGYLTELRDSSLAKPEDLYLLLMWMNQNDLSLIVAEWLQTFPADVVSETPTCVAVADTYIRTHEWNRLKDFVDERSWGESDYLRRAFRARALEKLGDAGESAQEWKDGISAARSRDDSRERLERMVRLAIGWGWTQQAQEVMWTMVAAPNCPRWVLDALWAISIESRDVSRLQTLAGILAKADSKSLVFRNNRAFYSLLSRSETGNPHGEAERLFNENPGNASVAMTWGLSLYQRGKMAEAIAVTGSLPADALQRPQVALYHAIFLTAAGEGGKAAEFLAVAQDWKMFPEEKTLLDRAKTIATKAGGDQEIAASANALRAAKAARDLEAEKAVVAARAERLAKAAQAAQEAAQEAAQSPAPEKSGGQVPPR